MYPHRRQFLRGLLTVAGAASASTAIAQHQHPAPQSPGPSRARQVPGAIAPRVVTPDVPLLPWKMVGGVKEFHLVAEPVKSEFLPGPSRGRLGLQRHMPGPTIEVEGGRPRARSSSTTACPSPLGALARARGADRDGRRARHQRRSRSRLAGRSPTSSPSTSTGRSSTTRTWRMQEMMGMIGFFIIHPRAAYHAARSDATSGSSLQGWAMLPNNTIPNTLAMEFNWLTMNGKAGPATTPMLVEARRARPHAHREPRHGPPSACTCTAPVRGHRHRGRARSRSRSGTRSNTVLVGVAQARDVEFDADHAGRLDAPLPPAAPHDEPDGLDGRAHDERAPSRGRRGRNAAGAARAGHARSRHSSPASRRTWPSRWTRRWRSPRPSGSERDGRRE